MKQETTNKAVSEVNESKHTPGEWTARRTSTGNLVEAIGKPIVMYNESNDKRTDHHIPTIQIANFELSPHSEANARLIAAAPDMLKALKELSYMVTQTEFGFHPANVKAKMIIEKATK